MRVALIASAPPAALGMAQLIASTGHEVPAVVAIRAPAGRYGPAYPTALHDVAPGGDLLFVRSGRPLGGILTTYDVDVALCASFPAIIPDDALEAPRHGIINFHPALLPKYRGPNPLGWAMRNGDAEIGMTAHRMTSELDKGPIFAQGRLATDLDEDLATEGQERFAAVVGPVLVEALQRVEAGDPGDEQDEAQATYAGPFEAEYLEVDWSRPAAEVHAQVRAWSMAPPVNGSRGPFTEFDGERVRIARTRLNDALGGRRVVCGDGEPIWVVATEPA